MANHHQIFQMAWSSSDGTAIQYVLPVLRVTSCFHIMALWRIMCTAKWQQNVTSIITENLAKLCSIIKKKLEVLIASWALGSKSATYDCPVWKYAKHKVDWGSFSCSFWRQTFQSWFMHLKGSGSVYDHHCGFASGISFQINTAWDILWTCGADCAINTD